MVVPGGSGARREIENPATVRWLTETCAKASWITSVCTGSFLLVGCGIARGRRVTTHHNFIKALRDQGGAEVVEGVRFVRDRNVVSAAGVMSGIEMSLWLVGELYGGERRLTCGDAITVITPSSRLGRCVNCLAHLLIGAAAADVRDSAVDIGIARLGVLL